jgi:hypothetical protein
MPISPPPPLASSLPLSSPRFSSPSTAGLYGASSSSSSGTGLGSELFSSANVELRNDSWGGTDGGRVADPRSQLQRGQRRQIPAVHNIENDASLESQPTLSFGLGYIPNSPPALVDRDLSASLSAAYYEDAAEADDEHEEPPNLISATTSEEFIGYRYPFYGGAIPNSVQSHSPPTLSDSRLRSPPPPLLAPAQSMVPMSIPVPSAIYPAQYRQHPRANPAHDHSHAFPLSSHPVHFLPVPAGPSLSPSQSASISPAPSIHLHTQDKYPRKLRKGDVLYWHHLQRSGEIPGVAENKRARVGNGSYRGGGAGTRWKEMGEVGDEYAMIVGGR